MKKKYLLILSITFFNSVCFAQQATTFDQATTVSQSAIVSQTATTSPTDKTVTGKVDSVNGDGTKGVRSDITIEDDRLQQVNVVVKFGTSIIGKDGKTASFGDIKEGSKVTVEYITKSTGTNKAQSVKLVE
jgi:hypothetical protein